MILLVKGRRIYFYFYFFEEKNCLGRRKWLRWRKGDRSKQGEIGEREKKNFYLILILKTCKGMFGIFLEEKIKSKIKKKELLRMLAINR